MILGILDKNERLHRPGQKLEDGTWCHESNTSELKDMAMYTENSLGAPLA
jgi:hypothetical protein